MYLGTVGFSVQLDGVYEKVRAHSPDEDLQQYEPSCTFLYGFQPGCV